MCGGSNSLAQTSTTGLGGGQSTFVRLAGHDKSCLPCTMHLVTCQLSIDHEVTPQQEQKRPSIMMSTLHAVRKITSVAKTLKQIA